MFCVALSVRKTVAALVSLREGSFIFFCAVFACVCSLCDFTLHLCVSFIGLYALWLVFNTASAFILKAAFGCAGWHMSHCL